MLSNLVVHLKRRAPLIILLSILSLAAVLRFYELGTNPIGLNQDEAVNGYDALSLGLTMRDHHGNFLPLMLESYGDWASSLLTYITIPFVTLLGLNETAVRLPVAILGVLSVLLTYIYIRRLGGNTALALLAGFLLSITPWHIGLSRWAIPPSIVPFFLLLLLISLDYHYKTITEPVKGRSKKWPKMAIATVVTAVAAFLLTMAYPTQKIFVPLLLTAYCLIYFDIRKHLFKLASLAMVFSLLFLPLFLPSVLQPEKYNARFEDVSLANSNEGLIQGFVGRYAEYFSPRYLFGNGAPDNMHRVPTFGSNVEPTEIFFYIGLAILVVLSLRFGSQSLQLDKKWYRFVVALLILAAIPASMTLDRMHILRHVHGLLLVVLITALGFYSVVKSVKEKWFKQLIILSFVVLGLVYTAGFTNYYFTNYKEIAKIPFQYGVKETMHFLLENESKFAEVKIDHAITQPYIYYLFYHDIPPATLDYEQINASRLTNAAGNWRYVSQYNNYYFGEVGEAELNNKTPEDTSDDPKLIHEVKSEGRVFFRIYANNDFQWFVDRVI